jgi:hypothetical protein
MVGIHGVAKELVVGRTYEFGFVPPNNVCCEGTTQRVRIEDGEGTFTVTGKIKLKPAIIRATGAPERSVIACGMWGKTDTPPLVVTLNDPEEATLSCTVTPPTSSGVLPRTQTVKIRPGQAIDLWP